MEATRSDRRYIARRTLEARYVALAGNDGTLAMGYWTGEPDTLAAFLAAVRDELEYGAGDADTPISIHVVDHGGEEGKVDELGELVCLVDGEEDSFEDGVLATHRKEG